MTCTFDIDPEIACAACEVALLETLHEGLCNGTVPWHAWDDQLTGQDRTAMAIDESRRELVMAVAALEQLARERAMNREYGSGQSADAHGKAGAVGVEERDALPE